MTTIRTECSSCHGTGLYQGICERGGLYVQCSRCKGSGCDVVQYTPFDGRKNPPSNAVSVISHNPGIVLNEHIAGSDAVSVKDWQDGKLGKGEFREYVCPRWCEQSRGATIQSEKYCKNAAMAGKRFSDCFLFEIKHMCWKRYDEEKP